MSDLFDKILDYIDLVEKSKSQDLDTRNDWLFEIIENIKISSDKKERLYEALNDEYKKSLVYVERLKTHFSERSSAIKKEEYDSFKNALNKLTKKINDDSLSAYLLRSVALEKMNEHNNDKLIQALSMQQIMHNLFYYLEKFDEAFLYIAKEWPKLQRNATYH